MCQDKPEKSLCMTDRGTLHLPAVSRRSWGRRGRCCHRSSAGSGGGGGGRPSCSSGSALMGLPCCSRQYTVFSRSPAARSGPGSTASAGAAVGRPPTASSPVSRYNSMYAASFERRDRPSAAAAVTGVAEVSSRRHQPSQQPLLPPDTRKKLDIMSHVQRMSGVHYAQ